VSTEATTSPATIESRLASDYRSLPEDTGRLREIRRELDTKGVVELQGFLTPEAHELLRQQILELESAAMTSSAGSHQKYALKADRLTATLVGQFAGSQYAVDLVNRLLGDFEDAEAWIDTPIQEEELIPGINIMRGPGDTTAYHFDGTYLNLILPVVVPKIEGARRGQLVLYPNVRSFRRNFWSTKVVAGIARIPQLRRVWKKREVDYVEGALYLFYGYRTLHGVDSPAEPGLRCITNLTVGAPRFKE
jgi:hypothetical protein